MYVIVDDCFPDIIVETYNEMSEIISKSCKCAYFYKQVEDKWVATTRYSVLDGLVGYQKTDTWDCPPEYATYNFPNPCKTCKNTQFMMADYCTLCNEDDRCVDCGGEGGTCQCKYDDY